MSRPRKPCHGCGKPRYLSRQGQCDTCYRRANGLVVRRGKDGMFHVVPGEPIFQRSLASPERIAALSARASARLPLFPCYEG